MAIGFNGTTGNAAQLADYIYDTILPAYPVGTKPLLVAHSRGGLVARSFMNYSDQGDDIAGLITLGTPHHGSPFAVPDWDAISWGSRVGSYPFAEDVFDLLVSPDGRLGLGPYGLDTDRMGSLNLAWDNFDSAVGGSVSMSDLDVVIADNVSVQLTPRDMNQTSTHGDAAVWLSDLYKSTFGTLSWLNQNEHYLGSIVAFAAYDVALGDNPEISNALSIMWNLGGSIFSDHQALSVVTDLLAEMHLDVVSNSANYVANDGLVPIQSALLLNTAGGVSFATIDGNEDVTLNWATISSRQQVKAQHVWTGTSADHLWLLDASEDGYWDQITQEIMDFAHANQAPVDVSLSGTSVAENQAVGTVVGVLSGTDPDADQSTKLTFSLVSGYSDNGLFIIDPATKQLKTNAVFDFETKSTYNIMVRATDVGNPPMSYDELFVLCVSNVPPRTYTDYVSISVYADNVHSIDLNVLANDFAPFQGADPVSQLVLTKINGVSDPSRQVAGTYGYLDWTVTGDVTYRLDPANSAVQSLAPGKVLTDVFEYEASDGTDSRSSTLNILIQNLAPSELFVDTGQLFEPSPTHDADLADLDGDGDLDAFVTHERGEGNRVWFNDGSGKFVDSGQRLGTANSIYAALGDLDKDGDVDAFVATAQANLVWLNDGHGRFTDSGQRMGMIYSIDVALGDLDGDGDLDAYVTNWVQPDEVWMNNGQGVFADSGQRLGIDGKSVELGDLDGDGDLDAFVGNVNPDKPQPNQVLFNDGHGTFTDSGQRLGLAQTQHVALGDLDDDCDLDAVEAGGGPNNIWLNNGFGVFSASGQILTSYSSSHVALGDLDLDGDLDAYFANWFQQPDEIWLNRGDGFLFHTLQVLDHSTSSHVALGDLDDDGDLDAFVAKYDEPISVYKNPLTPLRGDANHDGVFNSGDLVQVFQEGEYEDGIAQLYLDRRRMDRRPRTRQQ